MFNKLCAFLNNESGEVYVGEAIKIVIAVVIGAALLVGTLVIFKDTIMPQTTIFVGKMFYQAFLIRHGFAMSVKDYHLMAEADGLEWGDEDRGIPYRPMVWDEVKNDPFYWSLVLEYI